MPGYTHMQRAVPSSVGLWLASFAEGFASDASMLISTRDWIDECPLGTAAGYGVNIDLPRDGNADRLGFARTLVNPMFAQATRGVCEAQVLGALWLPAQTLRRLSWDLVLFSSAEFGFVRLADTASTGSSIMPNKRNPDLAELLRGVAPVLSGCITELHALSALPSGYHRDLQGSKAPLIRGVRTALEALALVPNLIGGLEFHLDRMREAIDPTMFATDRAVELALSGASFRDAYRSVGDSIDNLGDRSPTASIRQRVSLGGPGNLALGRIGDRINALSAHECLRAFA
jgi:argininosuccinate lyase